MDIVNFPAEIAKRGILNPADVIPADDLLVIGKKVNFLRNGSQYQNFPMTVSDFLTLTSGIGPQGPQGIQGPQGPQGVQGIQGMTGAQGAALTILGEYIDYAAFLAGAGGSPGNPGDAWLVDGGELYVWDTDDNHWFNAGVILGPQGETGPQGVQGLQGIPGIDAPTDRIYSGLKQVIIDPLGTTTFSGDLLPDVDNVHDLGSLVKRFHSIFVGPDSLNMIDDFGNIVVLSAINGALVIDGADLIRIGNMNFTTTGIASAISSQDITVGDPGDTGYLATARGIKYPDNTVQTTAPVNADWNSPTGLSHILNKPSIPSAQVNSDWNSVSGLSQILNKPTIPSAQVNSDWNAVSGVAYILNKPTIPDLSGYGVPVAFNSTWAGTGLVHTGTPATGSYMKMNKMVEFNIAVDCATVSNFGTGQYSLTLPFVSAKTYTFIGHAYDTSSGKNYHVRGIVAAGSGILTLWDGNTAEYTVMDHTHPINIAVADKFYINGTYQTT